MRLATKRALDFYLGRPFLSILRLAARILGMLLRRDHALAPVRSILIVKFQGLGSLVICKPALAALRRQYPNARIIFWGTPAMLPLAQQMPELDELLVLDDRNVLSAVRSTLAALLRLWRVRIDWAFDLEVYSRLSSVLVTLSLGRNRTGFALEQLRSRRVHTHLIYFNRYMHLGEAYARIVGQLLPPGSMVDTNDYGAWRFALDPVPAIPRPYLLFNIHAGDLALERRWPRESFAELINELLQRRPDAVAVLIGHGQAEVAYSAGLAQGERIIDLSGRLNLTETYRAIAHAELVVTNDSAPLHFALSSGVKLLGLFGPTRAETYLPPGRTNVAAAHVPLYCSPCVHHWEPPPCNGDNQCMKRLTVPLVLARCCALLGLPAPAGTTAVPGLAANSVYYPGLVYRRPSRD
jgi:ADP-heptose:LPS heptosyltransferase